METAQKRSKYLLEMIRQTVYRCDHLWKQNKLKQGDWNKMTAESPNLMSTVEKTADDIDQETKETEVAVLTDRYVKNCEKMFKRRQQMRQKNGN